MRMKKAANSLVFVGAARRVVALREELLAQEAPVVFAQQRPLLSAHGPAAELQRPVHAALLHRKPTQCRVRHLRAADLGALLSTLLRPAGCRALALVVGLAPAAGVAHAAGVAALSTAAAGPRQALVPRPHALLLGEPGCPLR